MSAPHGRAILMVALPVAGAILGLAVGMLFVKPAPRVPAVLDGLPGPYPYHLGSVLHNQADPPGYGSRFYHGLHIQLLRELHLITGKQVFEDYADRFAGYVARPPEGVK
jgi:hypothetical protein